MKETKIDYVQLYRLYAGLTPIRKLVSISTFVKWAPVPKRRERESLGRGEWITHTFLNLGEDNEKEE